jgi:ribosomal protein S12 methylthiotransferase accessory factor
MVPADFVYYPAIRQKPLVFDTSNGASAHTDAVQAILNGLFEVIERDSFLTMWLNRFSMPTLNLKKLPFGFTESIRLMNEFGMCVKLVDITNDTRIPAIAAVCYNNDPGKYPALLVGAGSHIEPEKAVQKALFEMEFMLNEILEHPNKKKISHSSQISTMYEHPLYYMNPKMRKYWEFMISGKKTSKITTLLKRSSQDNHSTLRQIVKLLHGMKHRVIWVDITPSDLNRMGLKAVKVFVTGFQPLYVGNKLRLNLERLEEAAQYVSRDIKAKRAGSELNSAPHPLP